MTDQGSERPTFLSVTPEGGDFWAIGLGRLIINFGAIELLVNLLLEQWSTDSIVIEDRLGDRLARRLELLEKISVRSASLGDRAGQFAAALATVKKHLDTRNTIAHNPLVLGWKTEDRSDRPDFIGVPNLKKARTANDALAPVLSVPELAKCLDETANAVRVLESSVQKRPEFSVWLERR